MTDYLGTGITPSFRLLFKNLQERTLISCPSNLVYRFAILILENTFLVPSSDVPCCDLILIQLAGTQRTHYFTTATSHQPPKREHIHFSKLTVVFRLLIFHQFLINHYSIIPLVFQLYQLSSPLSVKDLSPQQSRNVGG